MPYMARSGIAYLSRDSWHAYSGKRVRVRINAAREGGLDINLDIT